MNYLTVKGDTIMKHVLCSLAMLIVVGLILASSAGALDDQDLAEIKKAIQEKGARWEAADNAIFRLSPEEQRRLLGAVLETPEEIQKTIRVYAPPRKDLPARLDWRDVDGVSYVTPVRNQGNCGSCVVFGTLASLEARIQYDRNRPNSGIDLSEQHCFSCGGGTCDGGWTPQASHDYLLSYGAPLESCLPYEAVDDNCEETCSDWQAQARKILEWGTIPFGSPQATVELIKTHLMDGPLTVSYTVYEDFMSYSSGVYQHVWGDVEAGHCVSFVGWDDADSCWICKNSWGPYWGENGYFRIRMGHNEVGIEERVRWMLVDPSAAYVSIDEYTIMDDASGNGDGVPDPGETLDFTVTLSNPPTYAVLTNISGWLVTSDPRVTPVNVMTTFPDLPDGSTCSNDAVPFSITLSEQIGVSPIFFTLYITGTSDGAYPYSAELVLELPITVPHAGWPVQTTSGLRSSPLMLWMVSGPRSLVAVDDGGFLHMWDQGGQEQPGFPFQARGGQVWGSVALEDLDADDRDEILFGSKNDTLYALQRDGHLFFRRDMGSEVMSTPAVADLNNSGSPEIILGTMDGQLHVLTAQGQKYDPFPITLGGPVMADAALADLDDDGTLDVVVGTSDGLLYVISGGTGQMLPGFPFATEGAIWSSPVIADLNGDGDEEIIFGSDDTNLYVLTSAGSVLFTYETDQPIRSSPAVADLDGNGYLDVIFTSHDGKVYAMNHQGYAVSGWPYATGKTLWNSPIVLDIDADGAMEVVVEVSGAQLLHLEADGTLLMSLPIQAGGIVMSTPVAGDLDNDGDLEIAVGSTNGVYVWNYPTPSTVDMPWPMYRGNARRTGYVEDVTTGRGEDAHPEPWVPARYALAQNYPNPFNPETTIRYSLARESLAKLTVYNILGQEIVTLVNDRQSAGAHEAVWSGQDARGRDVSSGLYFYRLEAGDFAETRKMVLMR